MRTGLVFFFSVLIFVSCKEETKKDIPDPKGKWENPVAWDNNYITWTIRPDSVMLFKCKKLFCPGTKYFVSAGKWSIENDSILVMKKFTDGRKYDLKELFPELSTIGSDSFNIIGLDMEARLLLTKDSLYDIELTGKRSKQKVYARKN
ncbi:MAG: hypothetical protein M3R17_02640 [Bacteroidota bacterium]|nr:hypothetical protein [Bacteroidota bacterium]